MRKTVIIGASTNKGRYAYAAAHMLQELGHEFVPVGIRPGTILGKKILKIQEEPAIGDVGTLTLYINPINQKQYYKYLLGLKPKRIIFNPGTENPEFKMLAEKQGIQTEFACTLVLLSTGQY
jgi:predicted CoA-binding protein